MIVVFGSINLDLIFSLPHIPRSGETVLGPSTRIEPGGKGANQAVAAARDGARVAMVGSVGRDALADGALVLLRGAGVDLTRVQAVGANTGCAAISVDPSGENAIAVGSGANLSTHADQAEDALLGPDTTLVLQMEVPAEASAALIRRARVAGSRVVLNLAPASALPEDALRAVDVLVVNETEGGWLAADLRCGASAVELSDRLGGLSVVLTRGSEGADIASRDGAWHEPAVAIQPVDTTAAGDCFVGVLAHRLDLGASLQAAVRRATAAAALCCMRPGSQGSIPTVAETDAFVAG
ncbi:MAG TPA: ribokinase [Acetobacteraceae bacterium]|jgi:ribokinase|nr:ribokinase [Acetobacteraceae bacterium]